MTTDHKARLGVALAGIAEVFNEPMTEAKIEAYLYALGDLDIEDLEAAAAMALKSCRFMPRPVELRQLVEQCRGGDAHAEWDALVSAVRHIGAYAAIEARERLSASTWELIHRLFGSWRTCCERLPLIGNYDHTQLRQRFIESYDAAGRARLITGELADNVRGFLEERRRHA